MREIPFCQWFALCTRPAAGTVQHPALGAVPTCRECADRFELEVDEFPEPAPAPEAGELTLPEF